MTIPNPEEVRLARETLYDLKDRGLCKCGAGHIYCSAFYEAVAQALSDYGQQRADEVVRAVREAYDRMGRGNLLPGELEEAAISAARGDGK